MKGESGCMALEALFLGEVYTSQRGGGTRWTASIKWRLPPKISLHLGSFSSFCFCSFKVTFLISWGHLKEGHSWIRKRSLRSSFLSLMITQFAMKLKEPNEPNTKTTQHGWCIAHRFWDGGHPACWYPSHEGLPCASCEISVSVVNF